jgi:protein-S-isoprenylcysteine O-methyltransferase Ste14
MQPFSGQKSFKLLLTHGNIERERRTKNLKGENVRKAMIVLGVVLLFAVGFMLLGMFLDIQIILKYNYTPISFTFTLIFVGALIGFLLAFKIMRHTNGLHHSKRNID